MHQQTTPPPSIPPTGSREERIESLLQRMTVDEKVSLCHAGSKFATNAVERLGIPKLVMSDGPHGVRQEFHEHSWEPLDVDWDVSTYLPTGSALAATWNPELAHRFGHVLGAEARARGKDIILGPGFNLMRDPRCGRNFEYLGEDPHLITRLVPGLIRGIQQNDVAACAKHFAMNNQEWYRGEVDARPDESTFRELYAPGFEAAVKEGGTWTVMGGYNKFHGQWCCHNRRLLVEVLKDEWGFDGAVISDWCAVHDDLEAALNGLEIEMGSSSDYRTFSLAEPFRRLLATGQVREQVLDDKVRRILGVLERVGKLGGRERSEGRGPGQEHSRQAREIAAEAPVLLKNDGLLPLDAGKLRRVAVIGENAALRHAAGGGSSGIKVPYEITPLEGIRELLGDGVEVVHAKGYPDSGMPYSSIPAEHMGIVDPGAGVRGWEVTWTNAHWVSTLPPVTETRESAEFQFEDGNVPVEGFHRGVWSAEVRGTLHVPETGTYTLALRADSNAVLRVNGTERLRLQQNHELATAICRVELEAGAACELEVAYEHHAGKALLQLRWARPGEEVREECSLREEALALAAGADAVLFFGGLNHLYDNEGGDRAHLGLPGKQDELIRDLVRCNPRTAVVLVAGAPVEMPWAEEVPAILHGWYAGLEAGRVFADILFGRVNPSGKLPCTFPKALADTPAVRLDDYRADVCEYKEGIFTGYRWYDREGIEPLFPFGHGLSYASFRLDGLRLEVPGGETDGPLVRVTCRLANTSHVAGKETVQLYVGDSEAPVPRPVRELKGFAKVSLEPGQSRELAFTLNRRDLSFWDATHDGWCFEPGAFEICLGFSSRDLPLRETVRLG